MHKQESSQENETHNLYLAREEELEELVIGGRIETKQNHC